MRECIFEGCRRRSQSRKSELGALLFPRYLLRAVKAVAEGGSRPQEGTRAVSRSAARAQLSRLFLDRSGREPGRGNGNDQEGRAATSGRRLYRRLPRLGLLSDRQLRGSDQAA